MTLTRREYTALGFLAVILLITASWWVLALWPLPSDAPAWLLRTRAVCFGSVHDGLPTTAGWMALIGQPVYMLATLWLISGQAVARGIRELSRATGGRVALSGAGLLTVAGLTAAAVRVAGASTRIPDADPVTLTAAEAPRLHDVAPPLKLTDQHGATITVIQFRGRPVFVAFAFGHCQTVCPLIVEDVLQAQRMTAELKPVVVVVTLDPWRDVPARLPALATQWRLGGDAYVLSGGVEAVERTLDGWRVGRARDTRTGEITHGPIVYVLDRNGEIAFAISGATNAATLAGVAQRL